MVILLCVDPKNQNQTFMKRSQQKISGFFFFFFFPLSCRLLPPLSALTPPYSRPCWCTNIDRRMTKAQNLIIPADAHWHPAIVSWKPCWIYGSTVQLDSHCADSYRPMKSCYRWGIHRQAYYIHIVAMLSPGRLMNWEFSTVHHNSDLSRSVCNQPPV